MARPTSQGVRRGEDRQKVVRRSCTHHADSLSLCLPRRFFFRFAACDASLFSLFERQAFARLNVDRSTLDAECARDIGFLTTRVSSCFVSARFLAKLDPDASSNARSNRYKCRDAASSKDLVYRQKEKDRIRSFRF